MTELPEEHSFDQIKVGDIISFTDEITKSRLESFAELSGDYNPLHMNESYAKNTKFKKQVCHGMLLASFFSKLVGMHMPGRNALYFSQTLNFQTPCYLDDKITVRGEVTDKSASTRIITLKTTIHNHTGTCLVEGVAKVLVRQD